MSGKLFKDALSNETIINMTDELLKYENEKNSNKKFEFEFVKIISAVAVIVLVFGLINILPIFSGAGIGLKGSKTSYEPIVYWELSEEAIALNKDWEQIMAEIEVLLENIDQISKYKNVLEEDMGQVYNEIIDEYQEEINNCQELLNKSQEILAQLEQYKKELNEKIEQNKELLNSALAGIPKIKEINPDFYGWLIVSHTTINYPVVQTDNNDYYLGYSFEKRRSPSGAIFADYRNDRDISKNRHTLIYGHNMLDNSMFQPLIQYGQKEDYFKDGIIELITEDAVYYYEIFSAHEEEPASGYVQIDFNSDEEYVEFLQTMKERSVFQKDVPLYENSKIITLSTCINDFKRDTRFVVQGVLIDVIKVK